MKKNKEEAIIKLSKQELNAYRSMHEEDTPNLWDRIEAGFEEEMHPSEDTIKYKNKVISLDKKIKRMRVAAVIAACVLITIIAVPILIVSNMKMGRKSDENQVSMDAVADGYEYDMDNGEEMEEAAEEVAEEPAGGYDAANDAVNGTSYDADSKQEAGTAAPADTTLQGARTDLDAFMVKFKSCIQIMKRVIK
ncbi:MAG: hypothetical protein NC225_10840 [Clostridium sp.]|nr:hypothetical protein [Clostridium sp.]MCM1399961.1 hypothetical protein [Clostridium sp.]MCM1460298.1 hypothetical protein [Bacteroides sp.]